MGIEPTAQAWEAWVLPLYDARLRAILVALSWIRQIRCPQEERRPTELGALPIRANDGASRTYSRRTTAAIAQGCLRNRSS
jgi:hypothetical protein